MLEILPGFPDDVLAVRATGQVTAKDYETVLTPAANAAFARHKKLRVYYEIAPGFTGFDPAAMWKDMTLGLSHWTGWARIAVVTDASWLRRTVAALSLFMPCPVKPFPHEEAEEARGWVRG